MIVFIMLKVICNFPFSVYDLIMKNVPEEQKIIIQFALTIIFSTGTFFGFRRLRAHYQKIMKSSENKTNEAARAILDSSFKPLRKPSTQQYKDLISSLDKDLISSPETDRRVSPIVIKHSSNPSSKKTCELLQEESLSLNSKESILVEGVFKNYQGKIASAYCKGEMKNNEFVGLGKVVFFNGETHLGRFKNHQLHGEGEIVLLDGTTLKGRFKYGQLEGEGVIKYGDGSLYRGNFKDGCLNGEGAIKGLNGDSLTGTFENNLLNGFGEIIQSSGNWYKGYFEKNRLNGKGSKFIKSKKLTFIGSFTNDKFDGMGKILYNGKILLSGLFEKGCFKGQMTENGRRQLEEIYSEVSILQFTHAGNGKELWEEETKTDEDCTRKRRNSEKKIHLVGPTVCLEV